MLINFKEWFLLENLTITHINPEDDWEQAEIAYQIANLSRIRPSRNKEPTIIALNDKEEVIGAVFTSWQEDSEASNFHGSPVAQWDFDVVVHPDWRGYEMVGIKLIRAAEKEKQNLERQYGIPSFSRLWVVNPKLAKLLQTPKFGYNADSEYEDGSAHVSKY